MTLTELKYIVALEQTQHFGKAAELMCVSQPTLSIGVKKLEQELGVQLFERLINKVIPTEVGEQIIEIAKQTLMQADMVRATAKNFQQSNGLVGNIRFGAIYTVCPYLLPKMIRALQNQAPSLKLFVKEAYTHQLMNELKTGSLDMALVSPPIPEADLFASCTLFSEDFYVLLPKNHALAKQSSISPADLRQERVFLLGGGNCFREQVLQACPGCDQPTLSDKSWVQGGSLETIRMMVASGLGVSVFPEMAIKTEKDLVVKPFASPVPQRKIALVWRKSFLQTEVVEAIKQSIFDSHQLS